MHLSRVSRNVNDIELLEREDKEFYKNTEQEELLHNAPKKNGNFFSYFSSRARCVAQKRRERKRQKRKLKTP